MGKLGAGVKGRRVAFSPTLDGLRVDPEVAAVVREAARVFETLGCVVDEVEPRWPPTYELIRGMWSAHYAGTYGHLLPEWRSRMDPGFVACIEDGFKISAADYIRMRGRKIDFWDAVRSFFERYDLLLTPSLSVAAFPVQKLNPDHWPVPERPWDWIGWASFSYPVQLHRPAGGDGAGRLHPGGPAGGAPDRGAPLRGPHRAAGLGGLRGGAPVGAAPPAGRLTPWERRER